jgi:carbamoyltransferase
MQPDSKLIVGYANTFHDPALAFSWNGRLFAEAMERPAQVKRALWMVGMHFAIRSVRRALKALGAERYESVVLRTSWAPRLVMRTMSTLWSLMYRWVEPTGFALPLDLPSQHGSFLGLLAFSQANFLRQAPVTTYMLRRELFPGRNVHIHVEPTPHHLAHAANAVYTSPFSECAVMVLDGSGDKESSTFFHYENGHFRLIDRNPFMHSLGLLYAAITHACGFSSAEGEEWKVMGLAAYGRPSPELYAFFRDRIEVKGLRVRIRVNRNELRTLERLVGGFRAPGDGDIERMADLAFNFQSCFADIVCEIAANFRKLGVSENLAFGGGCALNSAANGQILRRSGFRALHVPAAPGDDGNALGLVLYERYRHSPRTNFERLTPFIGSDIDQAYLKHVLLRSGLRSRTFESIEALCKDTAAAIAEGQIVGWMHGRAEFGPRALGNRSILADPRRAEMKDRINTTVKFREKYRPLAPSVLIEHAPDYFNDFQESPYMERTLSFREEAARTVPAVVHKDGTGRLQTVDNNWNPEYWMLIDAFREKTGVAMLLNTSLNVMGRPIVHSVEDAMTLFFTTGLDRLVIDRMVLEKDAVRD